MSDGSASPFIVMFHSFKGGVGRTSSMLNTGLLLAEQGKSVLLIDLDLEASGLRYFPSILKSQRNEHSRRGFVGWLAANSDVDGVDDSAEGLPDIWRESRDWPSDLEPYLIDVGLPCKGEGSATGSLQFLDAGEDNDDSRSVVNAIGLFDPFLSREAEEMGVLLKEELKSLEPPVDYVLVDCRPGLSGVSLFAIDEFSDACVLLTTTHAQSIDGVMRLHDRISRSRNKHLRERELIVFSPVVSRDDEDGKLVNARINAFYDVLEQYDSERRMGGFLERKQALSLPWHFGLHIKEWDLSEDWSDDEGRGTAEPTIVKSAYRQAIKSIASRLKYLNPYDSVYRFRKRVAKAKLEADRNQIIDLVSEALTEDEDRDIDLLEQAAQALWFVGEDELALDHLYRCLDMLKGDDNFLMLLAKAQMKVAIEKDRNQDISGYHRAHEALKEILGKVSDSSSALTDLSNYAILAKAALWRGELNQIRGLFDRIEEEVSSRRKGRKKDLVEAWPDSFTRFAPPKVLVRLEVIQRIAEGVRQSLLTDREVEELVPVALYGPVYQHPEPLAQRRRPEVNKSEAKTISWDALVRDLRFEDPARGTDGFFDNIKVALKRKNFERMRYLVHSEGHPQTAWSRIRDALENEVGPSVLDRIEVYVLPRREIEFYLQADMYLYTYPGWNQPKDPKALLREVVVGATWFMGTLEDDIDWIVGREQRVDQGDGTSVTGSFPPAEFSNTFEEMLERAKPLHKAQ